MANRTTQTLLLAVLLTLCGCKNSETIPDIPQAPIEASGNYADKQDAAIERAAGFVKVAKEENGKSSESEQKANVDVLLEAAESFLDEPKPKDIQQAKALVADHKRLDAIKADAEKTIKEINEAWTKVVVDAERRRVEAEQNLKRTQMELEAACKREQAHLLGMLGAGLIAVGTLLLLFGHLVGIGKVGALCVIAAGVGTAALPRIFESPYFVYGALSLLGIAGAQMLVALGRKLFARKQAPVDNSNDTPSI